MSCKDKPGSDTHPWLTLHWLIHAPTPISISRAYGRRILPVEHIIWDLGIDEWFQSVLFTLI